MDRGCALRRDPPANTHPPPPPPHSAAGYTTRDTGDSQGVALGAACLPSAAAGLAAAYTRVRSPRGALLFRLLLPTTAAAGFTTLAWFAHTAARRGERTDSSDGGKSVRSGREPRRSARRAASTSAGARSDDVETNGRGLTRASVSQRSLRSAGGGGGSSDDGGDAQTTTPQPSTRHHALRALAHSLCALATIVLAATAHGALSGAAVAVVSAAAPLATHATLTLLPRSFTLGEAAVTSVALVAGVADAVAVAAAVVPGRVGEGVFAVLPAALSPRDRAPVAIFTSCTVILATLGAAAAAPLARRAFGWGAPTKPPRGRGGARAADPPPRATAAALLAALALALTPPAVAGARWALPYALATRRHRATAGAWCGALAVGLPAMHAAAGARSLSTILLRKGYHVLAGAMFAPVALTAPGLLAAGTSVAAAALAMVEATRVARVPRLGPAVHAFMARFVDGRDAGAVLVSHFSLLAGMAAPVWMAAAGARRDELAPDARLTPPSVAAAALAGIVALGALDTAASAVGRAVGTRRLFGTPKTAEGAAAGAVSAAVAWLAVATVAGAPSIPTAIVGSVLMAGLEATTTQLDNIFLPLHAVAVVAAVG